MTPFSEIMVNLVRPPPKIKPKESAENLKTTRQISCFFDHSFQTRGQSEKLLILIESRGPVIFMDLGVSNLVYMTHFLHQNIAEVLRFSDLLKVL